MRQRVVRVAVAAVLVALVLFALPLAAAIRLYLVADELNALERDALAAAVRVSPDFTSGDPVELPAAGTGRQLGLYDARMRLRAGTGPADAGGPVRRAAAGKLVRTHDGGQLVVAVPVPHDEQVIGVVRASSDTGAAVWRRVITAWLALLGIAMLALGAAVFTARRQARALSEPLEDLSRTCRAVTDGDLRARAAPSAVAEIDQVARTHNEMVQRLAQLLQNERDFTSNASHQLRTPITGLQLGLESALSTPGADLRTAVEEALERTRHLHGTVEEVLQLARTRQPAPASAALELLGRLLDDLENRWHGLFARDGRRLDFPVAPELRSVPVPGRPLAQILDILLDNARGHGHGSVEVSARDLADAVALDVRDEGAIRTDPAALFARGHTTGTGAGIGLALAREIAEAAGGRLVLANPGPTTFTLLIPLSGAE